MTSLWFCVPAHGRVELAAICLRQLRRTCDELTAEGIEASAVVISYPQILDDMIADNGPLAIAEDLGFATVRRSNEFLSAKFNDGIQLACDPNYNPRPADYVVPCGSDDWIDYRILLTLPSPDRILGFKRLSFVREDGREIASTEVRYRGGCGIRVYPREVMAMLDYRPAHEDFKRACDTSILTNLRTEHQRRYGRDLLIAYNDQHDRQIVDWKNPDVQLNQYRDLEMWWAGEPRPDPFSELAGTFPAEALEEMRALYTSRVAVAA